MNKIFFSVIVPCFNVEDYLETCLDSILKQTYSNFEIILIDDGSTDGTGEICDKYGALSEKISVYHKENGGVSDARNYGMKKATGDYFIFVDSDDFIKKDALENFEKSLRKNYPQVLLTRLTEYYDEDDIVEQDTEMKDYFSDGVSPEKALNWEMKKSKGTWPATKKIISREFVEKNDMHFLKGVLHEDVDWSARVMMRAQSFQVCTRQWYYHRRRRKGSITNTISSKRVTDVIEMAVDLIDGCEMGSLPIEKKKIITERIMRSVYWTLSFYKLLTPTDREKVVDCCEKNRNLFRISPDLRHKVFRLSVNVFGIKMSIECLRHFQVLLGRLRLLSQV